MLYMGWDLDRKKFIFAEMMMMELAMHIYVAQQKKIY